MRPLQVPSPRPSSRPSRPHARLVATCLATCLATGCVHGSTVLAPAEAPRASSPLPLTGQRWLEHVREDLLPFWDDERAFGAPAGAFESTRCNDGSLVRGSQPCLEVGGNPWLMQGGRYLVSLSRQTFLYGVAFHLTGEPRYLALAEAGVRFIREEAVDRERGGMKLLQAPDGNWGPAWEHRNPQELAYGLLGLAFHFYLTRDEGVLADIVAVRRHIFSRYRHREGRGLQWMLAKRDEEQAEELRLVAQLDQPNAYMALLTPLLPEAERSEWLSDLRWIARSLREQFYWPKQNLMWLRAGPPEGPWAYWAREAVADFGHSIKTMWMLRTIGLLADDPELVRFAEESGGRILERAYRVDSGSWAYGLRPDGTLELTYNWFAYCELNQYAATLALRDSTYARYLPRAQAFWLQYFVDRPRGEVWTTLDGWSQKPRPGDLPKQWPWKNGYHTFEHALVSYIAGQQLHGLPVRLHFAFEQRPSDAALRPYLFEGRVRSVQAVRADGGRKLWTVEFDGVR
jgi:mannose/cellobiose epimerase-like protein (N-acyl-D-glucosamine 2-epimerase family)